MATSVQRDQTEAERQDARAKGESADEMWVISSGALETYPSGRALTASTREVTSCQCEGRPESCLTTASHVQLNLGDEGSARNAVSVREFLAQLSRDGDCTRVEGCCARCGRFDREKDAHLDRAGQRLSITVPR